MSAQAGEWSYFSYLGNSVSVSFNQVDATTYTWKFRNDASSRITYMEFDLLLRRRECRTLQDG